MSIASRGVLNKSIDTPTKQLRVLSCFGNDDIPKCPYLQKSKTSKYSYCSKCGCGDKNRSWLLKEPMEYAKLDYPVLNCPVKMPGFTNYDPNFVNKDIKDRKEKIENFDPEKLQYIQVTINKNKETEDIMDELNKILKNS